MVCYNWEVKFQGQHKLISWFPKININKDNKDNIIIYAWFKNILKGLRIRTFHGLKKWFFSSEKGLEENSGDTLPLENYFLKITLSNIPKNAHPANIDINRTPSTRIFFYSCMKCNDAEQIVLNMHFFFTFSHWFALLPINSLENLYRFGHGIKLLGMNYRKLLIWKIRRSTLPPFHRLALPYKSRDFFFYTNHEWRKLHRTEYELTNNRTRTILRTMYEDSIAELPNYYFCIYIY